MCQEQDTVLQSPYKYLQVITGLIQGMHMVQKKLFRQTRSDFWNIVFMAPRIKLIVIFNLLLREFVEMNGRRFDLLLQILITQTGSKVS